ncbi:MAG: hypothetical protein JSR87_05625 [Proteobacteria bacterium]|nr:hypothetical protein [Pseudomonadota bacterium]MBS0574046.1 hypothetical protein [Pseudomonadota bacterium]
MRLAPLCLLALAATAPGSAFAACAAPLLTVAAAPQAMLRVAVDAPCLPGAVADLVHGGLGFRVRLDDSGRFSTALPALDPSGLVTASLAGGTTLAARGPVPEMAGVRRLALATRGTTALRLDVGDGIRLTILGDPSLPGPRLVQIADLPAGGPSPHLTLSAEVTAQSCGHDLLATALLVSGDSAPQGEAISLAMPECGPDAQSAHLSLDLGRELLARPRD